MTHRSFVVWGIFALMFFSVLPIFASGISEESMDYTGSEGRITVYLSGPSQMINKLEKAFEMEQGDVLDIVSMGCGPLRQRVWTEFETGDIHADVVWGSDPLLYIALDKEQALEPYIPVGIDSLRPEQRTERNYTLVNERYGVIIYNPDAFAPGMAPKSFEDLLDSRFKGGLVHADPEQSSTALALVAGLWDMYQRDWFFYRGLVSNDLFLAKKNSAVSSKIMEKEFIAGIAPHDEAMRLQKKAKLEGYPADLAICWPEEGVLAIQRPIAIIKNSARPEANEKIARAFVDFMISKKAQTITSNFAFVSVRSDIPHPQGIPENVKINRVDWEYLSVNQEKISEDFNALF